MRNFDIIKGIDGLGIINRIDEKRKDYESR